MDIRSPANKSNLSNESIIQKQGAPQTQTPERKNTWGTSCSNRSGKRNLCSCHLELLANSNPQSQHGTTNHCCRIVHPKLEKRW